MKKEKESEEISQKILKSTSGWILVMMIPYQQNQPSKGEIVQAYRVTDNGLVELSQDELQAYKAQEEEANKSAQLELDKDSSQKNSQNNGPITPNAINEYDTNNLHSNLCCTYGFS